MRTDTQSVTTTHPGDGKQFLYEICWFKPRSPQAKEAAGLFLQDFVALPLPKGAAFEEYVQAATPGTVMELEHSSFLTGFGLSLEYARGVWHMRLMYSLGEGVYWMSKHAIKPDAVTKTHARDKFLKNPEAHELITEERFRDRFRTLNAMRGEASRAKPFRRVVAESLSQRRADAPRGAL